MAPAFLGDEHTTKDAHRQSMSPRVSILDLPSGLATLIALTLVPVSLTLLSPLWGAGTAAVTDELFNHGDDSLLHGQMRFRAGILVMAVLAAVVIGLSLLVGGVGTLISEAIDSRSRCGFLEVGGLLAASVCLPLLIQTLYAFLYFFGIWITFAPITKQRPMLDAMYESLIVGPQQLWTVWRPWWIGASKVLLIGIICIGGVSTLVQYRSRQ